MSVFTVSKRAAVFGGTCSAKHMTLQYNIFTDV
jgi:hypothetical protein